MSPAKVPAEIPRAPRSKPLGQSSKDRAANAELRRANANPRAVSDFIDRVADVQNIEAQFRPLPDPQIEFLDNAGVNGRIFRQRRAVWHGGRACAQAALYQQIR